MANKAIFLFGVACIISFIAFDDVRIRSFLDADDAVNLITLLFTGAIVK